MAQHDERTTSQRRPAPFGRIAGIIEVEVDEGPISDARSPALPPRFDGAHKVVAEWDRHNPATNPAPGTTSRRRSVRVASAKREPPGAWAPAARRSNSAQVGAPSHSVSIELRIERVRERGQRK
jgi:hypothetical protein